MKANTKVLALMTALVAGSAYAAPTANPNGYTTAGDDITNVATATFTDPTKTDGSTMTSTSNEVTTKVMPLPSFDIVYGSANTDGSGVASNPANSATASTPDKYLNATPGQVVPDSYYLVNNGNTPLVVTITPQTTKQGESVTYTYVDPVSGDTITTTANTAFNVVLPAGAVIPMTQNTTVPSSGLAGGTILGATPSGVANPKTTATIGTTTYNNANYGLPGTMSEDQTVVNGAVTGPAAGTDLQYQAIVVYKSDVSVDPQDGDPGTVGQQDPSTTVRPPGTTTPVPGYTDPTNPGTIIEVKPNEQVAYPPADTNGDPDSVQFTNSVTNNGSIADQVTLFPPTNLPTGVTVTIGVTDEDPNTPGIQVTVKPGTTVNYPVTVTYPDSNSVPNPTQITFEIGVDSGLDGDTTPESSTRDTIYPAAAQFGDTPAETATPLTENPGYVQSQTTSAGSTATYNMSLANTGLYEDDYTLSGYVIVPLNDGTYTIVPVNYSGADIAQTGTRTVTVPDPASTTGGTLTATIPVYTLSDVAPGENPDFQAQVAVPANAAATGSTPPTLQQFAESVASDTDKNPATINSGISLLDSNDPLVISAAGNVVVGKFTKDSAAAPAAGNTQHVEGFPNATAYLTPVSTDPLTALKQIANPGGYTTQPTSYLPQTQYDYQIIAKNAYNVEVTGLQVSDTLKPGLLFQSATCTVKDASGTTVGTLALANPAPVVGAENQTVACAPTTLKTGYSVVLDIFVKIK